MVKISRRTIIYNITLVKSDPPKKEREREEETVTMVVVVVVVVVLRWLSFLLLSCFFSCCWRGSAIRASRPRPCGTTVHRRPW